MIWFVIFMIMASSSALMLYLDHKDIRNRDTEIGNLREIVAMQERIIVHHNSLIAANRLSRESA